MYRKLSEINADIQATVAAIEAEGNDERITMAAKFFHPLDIKYGADRLGLDKAPKISAAIALLSEEGHYPKDFRRWHYGERGSQTQKLAYLLNEKENAVEHYMQEERRPRTPRDLLVEALTSAEASAGVMEIDEIAWLIGNFGNQDWELRDICNGMPRLTAKLAEMTAMDSRGALLECNRRRNDDDVVAGIADRIIRLKERR